MVLKSVNPLSLKELFDNATEEVVGPVRFAHQWVNTSDVTVTFNGSEVSTCRPSMGFSFAAGIPDGPGLPPFTNGICFLHHFNVFCCCCFCMFGFMLFA